MAEQCFFTYFFLGGEGNKVMPLTCAVPQTTLGVYVYKLGFLLASHSALGMLRFP